MNNLLLIKNIFFSILLLSVSSAIAQKKEIRYSGVLTGWRENNLKDSVKTVRYFQTHLSTEFIKSLKYETLKGGNDVKRHKNGYNEFDIHGMVIIALHNIEDSITSDISQQHPNRIEYDIKDRIKKNKYTVSNPIPYPAYDCKSINLNKFLWSNGGGGRNNKSEPDLLQYIYTYIYDPSGRIKEQKEYNYYGEYKIETQPKKEYLFTRKVYEYDTRGNIINQRVYGGPVGYRIGSYMFRYISLTFDGDIRISYAYDDQNRLIKMSYYGNQELLEEDEYTYHATENYITQIKRYVNDLPGGFYPTKRMKSTYNKQGDILTIDFDLEGRPNSKYNPIYNRSYEYEYDSHNNWIKCKMYLLGHHSEPSIIAERIIEYYNESKN